MRDFYLRNKKPIDQLLIFVIALLAALLFFKYVLRLVAPFVLAFVLMLIISPTVDFLSGKVRIPRVLATVFSMIVVLSALGLLLSFVLKLLANQLFSFAAGFPEALDKALEIFAGFRQSYYEYFEFFPEDMKGFLDDTIVAAANSIALWAAGVAKSLSVSAVKGIPRTFVFMLITIISTFFMTKDKHKLTAFMGRQLPERLTNTVVILKKDIFGALWGYIKAQLILMGFTGIIAITGLTILRYEYSLLIGLFIAFMDALPLFGPSIVLWPWAAVCLLAGQYHFAAGLIVIYLCCTLCRQISEPKVLSSQIGLHPLVTLLALYAGLMLLGAAGLIVGPLLAIIIRSLQNADMLPKWR